VRHLLGSLVFALPLVGVAACLSFGDLEGNDADSGADATTADASDSGLIVDTSTIDTSFVVDTGPPGSGDGGILACNAFGLVAYYPMTEGAGTTTTDCFQGLQGTFAADDGGAVSWGTRGDSGSSLEFTGDGYVMLGVRPQFQLPGPFTITGWLRVDTTPTNYISLFYNFAAPQLTGVELASSPTNATYLQMGFGTTLAEVSFPMLPAHTWEHLAATYTPGVGIALFYNGISVAAATMTEDGGAIPDAGFASNTGRQSRLGATFANSYWSGGIDDVRLFSRVLTDTEIKTLASQ
jgi:hypothetical protein